MPRVDPPLERHTTPWDPAEDPKYARALITLWRQLHGPVVGQVAPANLLERALAEIERLRADNEALRAHATTALAALEDWGCHRHYAREIDGICADTSRMVQCGGCDAIGALHDVVDLPEPS